MTRERATAVSWPNKPLPETHKVLEIDGAYSLAEFEMMRLGVIPQSAADKWFIYEDDGWLHFHRSATGTCVFQMQLAAQEGAYGVVQARVNRDPVQYRSSDDEYDVALMSYLVDTLLLGRFAPLPTPKGLRQEDRARYKQDMTGRPSDGSIGLPLQNGSPD